MESFPYLSMIVWLPLLGAVLLALFVPAEDERTARRLSLFFSVLTFCVSLGVLSRFEVGVGELQLDERWFPWPRQFGTSYHLAVDGISLWLVLLTTFLTPIAMLSSWRSITERVKEHFVWLLVLETGMLGVFLSFDLLLFYVFFEFTLVPLFFIIGIWGGKERNFAARKFFIYTLTGSLITFLGILYVALAYSPGGNLTFDLPALYQASIPAEVQWWLFLAFFAGFAIKVPLFPFHTWLPLAHTEAPTAGSVILAGVLLKMGTYAFLRFSIPLLPEASVQLLPLMSWLAVGGILYGALVALVQEDIKKLVAYSSVSHLGFCMLGMFALTAPGMGGSLLQMVNHGLSTGALFMLVGMIYERYHTRQIADLGGLAKRLPVLSFFMLLITLSSIGLPGLNGFVGEFLVLVGTFISDYAGSGPLMAMLGGFGIVLGAWYMLWLVQRVFFGPTKEPASGSETVHDLDRREIAMLVPIAVLVVWIGVYPKPFLERMEPSIQEILNHVPPPARTVDESVGSVDVEADQKTTAASGTPTRPSATTKVERNLFRSG